MSSSHSNRERAVWAAIVRARTASLAATGDQAAAFVGALDDEGYAIVAAYKSDRSMMHPIDYDGLQAIGDALERGRAKHGFYETMMCVYNECVQQGELAEPPSRPSATPPPSEERPAEPTAEPSVTRATRPAMNSPGGNRQ